MTDLSIGCRYWRNGPNKKWTQYPVIVWAIGAKEALVKEDAKDSPPEAYAWIPREEIVPLPREERNPA